VSDYTVVSYVPRFKKNDIVTVNREIEIDEKTFWSGKSMDKGFTWFPGMTGRVLSGSHPMGGHGLLTYTIEMEVAGKEYKVFYIPEYVLEEAKDG